MEILSLVRLSASSYTRRKRKKEEKKKAKETSLTTSDSSKTPFSDLISEDKFSVNFENSVRAIFLAEGVYNTFTSIKRSNIEKAFQLESDMKAALESLAAGKNLDAYFDDHNLHGDLADCREFHLLGKTSDIVVIYKVDILETRIKVNDKLQKVFIPAALIAKIDGHNVFTSSKVKRQIKTTINRFFSKT